MSELAREAAFALIVQHRSHSPAPGRPVPFALHTPAEDLSAAASGKGWTTGGRTAKAAPVVGEVQDYGPVVGRDRVAQTCSLFRRS